MSDTLFYDGKCLICSKEIRLLQRMKSTSLRLIDIHSKECFDASGDKSTLELLNVLHLKTADEKWLVGVDATVKAWRHTSIGWLLIPLRWPLIKPVVDKFYNKWASQRVCNLEGKTS